MDKNAFACFTCALYTNLRLEANLHKLEESRSWLMQKFHCLLVWTQAEELHLLHAVHASDNANTAAHRFGKLRE